MSFFYFKPINVHQISTNNRLPIGVPEISAEIFEGSTAHSRCFKEINYKFVMDFDYFLKSFEPLDHHKALSNNGTMKHMERFRKMINVAHKNEWMKKDPFKAYKMKFTKYDRG